MANQSDDQPPQQNQPQRGRADPLCADPVFPHHYQAGEYGEGDERQATGVGPRNADAGAQVLNDERGYADNYGNVAPGRYGVHGYSGSRGYPAPADERLRALIRERLTEDPDIDASNVTIEVSNGSVTLTGMVDTRRTRHEVEQCVENCGATEVHNNLIVIPT